jgi:carboxylesterase type B
VFCSLVKKISPTYFPSYITGNISNYPVEDFVKGSNYGVVSVAIQYRLGVFGELRAVARFGVEGD